MNRRLSHTFRILRLCLLPQAERVAELTSATSTYMSTTGKLNQHHQSVKLLQNFAYNITATLKSKILRAHNCETSKNAGSPVGNSTQFREKIEFLMFLLWSRGGEALRVGA